MNTIVESIANAYKIDNIVKKVLKELNLKNIFVTFPASLLENNNLYEISFYKNLSDDLFNDSKINSYKKSKKLFDMWIYYNKNLEAKIKSEIAKKMIKGEFE